MGLCGRDEELKQLLNVAAATNDDDKDGSPTTPTTRLCWLHGGSGCGKSALADNFLQHLQERQQQLLLQGKGKFDADQEEPFSAWADCLGAVLAEAVRLSNESAGSETEKVQMNLPAANVAVLTTAMPVLASSLERLFSCPTPVPDDQSTSSGQQQNLPTQWGLDRLRVATRSLLRCLVARKACAKIVLFLDDIQWMDEGSWKLFETLLLDTQLDGKLLLVATSRPLKQDNPLRIAMELPDGVIASMTLALEITNLSETSVAQILSRLLQRSDMNDVLTLAAVVHRKTAGSPFFVLYFLRQLVDQGLIYYSWQLYQWEWNVERIMAETSLLRADMHMLSDKIRNSSPDIQKLLTTAACVGRTRFDVEIIRQLIPHTVNGKSREHVGSPGEKKVDGDNDDDRDHSAPYKKMLEQAVKEGFIDHLTSSNKFKFAHDHIRESAMELLPKGEERLNLHTNYGRTLERISDERSGEEEATSLFLLSVHHQNLGKSMLTDPVQRQRLAEQNNAAAKIAFEQSAFAQSTGYLEAGLDLLGDAKWKDHYKLTVEMSLMLAHVHYCNGEQDLSTRTVKSLFKNAQSFRHILPAYRTHALLLFDAGEPKQCIMVLVEALAKLGFKVPLRFKIYHLLRGFHREKKFLRALSRDDLMADLTIQDEEVFKTAEHISEFTALLGEIVSIRIILQEESWVQRSNKKQKQAYFSGFAEILLLATLQYIGYGLRVGCTGNESLVLGGITILHTLLGSKFDAKHYAEMALERADGMKQPSQDGRAILIVHYFCWNSFNSYADSLDPALRALRAFLDTGVIEYIHIAMVNYVQMYFLAGLALPPLKKELSGFLEILRDYSQYHGLKEMFPFAQLVDCLTGETTDPLEFTGKHMRFDEVLARDRRSEDKFLYHLAHLLRMILAIFIGDFTLANDMRKNLLPRREEMPPFVVARDFYSALLAFDRGKKRLGRYYQRLVYEAARNGNPNAHHMTLLLHAEERAASRRPIADTVRKLYDDAITAAGRAGFLHHHALANERAGVFCSRCPGLSVWTSTYLTRAILLYEDWGAAYKGMSLRKAHPELDSSLKPSGMTDNSRGNKARTRMGNLRASRHKQSLM